MKQAKAVTDGVQEIPPAPGPALGLVADAPIAKIVGETQTKAKAETPKPSFPTGALPIAKPVIQLVEYIHMHNVPPYNGMTKELRPEFAYVIQGAIVIDELGLVLPLAGAVIRTLRTK